MLRMILGIFTLLIAPAARADDMRAVDGDPNYRLAHPPERRLEPHAAPMRKGLYWFGVQGAYANSRYGEELLPMVHRHLPNLAVVMVELYPERLEQIPFYREQGIPTIIQNFGMGNEGTGYLNYYHEHDAFEIDWRGRNLADPAHGFGQGVAHAAALSHPARHEAFTRVIKSAVRSGFTGFGLQDLSWFWSGDRGRAGYHPKTIEAFRRNLAGQDTGLLLQKGDEPPKRIWFRDYAGYYLGGMPEPAHFGLRSWREFTPLTFEQYQQATPHQQLRHDILFDLLTSYELMRTTSELGAIAEAESGIFQWVSNPEWFAHACDALFSIALQDVYAYSEQFFWGPEFLDGAYFRFPYLARWRSPQRQVGVIMEQGGGGNQWPYYSNEIAYTAAYELTAATGADHLEGDFAPAVRRELPVVLDHDRLRTRLQVILAFGSGFHHAYEDQLARLPPQFISVTSRPLLRVLGPQWHPWTWRLNHSSSPDPLLMRSGYIFAGVGEEWLFDLEGEHRLLIYQPTIPTQKGWSALRQLLLRGRVQTAVSSAVNLQEVLTPQFEKRPLHSIEPALRFAAEETQWRGQLRWSDGGAEDGELELSGEAFTTDAAGWQALAMLDDRPVVVRRHVGRGELIVLLFDPSHPENERLAQAIYRRLLEQADIFPQWRSVDGAVARIYRNDPLTVVGVHSHANRQWWTEHRYAQPAGPASKVPYHMPGTTAAVKIQLGTDHSSFTWVSLPSGGRGTAAVDEDGFVSLFVEDTGHEIFYLLPETEPAALLDRYLERKPAFQRTITLDGAITQ